MIFQSQGQMMKLNFLIFFAILAIVFQISAVETKGVHQFKVDNIDGKPVGLADYSGKVLLIVNTASNCGYTPQYNELEAVYLKYKDKGLVVLGFPSNDFGGQEPGSNEEIKKFCNIKDGKYKISFPMFAKSNVKSEPKNPLFQFLTEKANTAMTGPVKWNFEKFIINKNGEMLARFPAKVTPNSAEITNVLEKELGLLNKL